MNLDMMSFKSILKPEVLDRLPANARVFHADGKVLAEFENGETVSVHNLVGIEMEKTQ